METKTLLSRNLRKQSTPWERRIWSVLRNRQFRNYKFRRQHPLGPYIVDICCPGKKLVVELDGGQHNEAFNRALDSNRQKYLESKGYKVIRVWNQEINQNMDGVVERILESLEADSSPGSQENQQIFLGGPPQPSPLEEERETSKPRARVPSPPLGGEGKGEVA